MTNAICTAYPGTGARVATGASRPAFGHLSGALARIATRAFNVLVTWQRRAETRLRLRELDNRLLADVGLTRSDVRAETEKPFWTA